MQENKLYKLAWLKTGCVLDDVIVGYEINENETTFKQEYSEIRHMTTLFPILEVRRMQNGIVVCKKNNFDAYNNSVRYCIRGEYASDHVHQLLVELIDCTAEKSIQIFSKIQINDYNSNNKIIMDKYKKTIFKYMNDLFGKSYKYKIVFTFSFIDNKHGENDSPDIKYSINSNTNVYNLEH
jgi:hypothetical protein